MQKTNFFRTTIISKIPNGVYKKRPKEAKKYDFGLLLIIGGSKFYSGSPALNAMAAFMSGVDMVHILAPERPADIIASFSPNFATEPLEGDYLERKHLPILISMTERAKKVSRGKTAVVIGGGMGREEETKEAILEYLKEISVPVVIDADAIHAVGKKPEIVFKKNFLITPHSYEFFVLTGREISKLSEKEKMKVVQKEAERLQTTILLKGPTDIISNGKEVALNRTGSPYQTTGGCGDTLAGICGAILARGIDIFTAGQTGAFINGLAGELAAKRLGESLMATDLIDEIPNVLPKF